MSENETIRQISNYNEIFQLIWRGMGVKAGQKVLDIGIGSKAFSAKQMVDQELEVVGIDINPDCQVHSDELGIPIYICDACSLPFGDDSDLLHKIGNTTHMSLGTPLKRPLLWV